MARSGLSDLLTELRGLCEAGTAEYIVGAGTYWGDDQLQNILDIHRTDIVFSQLQFYPTVTTGGSMLYQDYRSSFGFWESGTDVFTLQDSTGATVGTADYTPDYRRGQFQFTANQAGTVYYVTGRSYDLNASAADVWRRKAAHYAPSSFDFSTDNHRINREQVYQHCIEMADYFDGKSNSSVQTVSMYRSDTC